MVKAIEPGSYARPWSEEAEKEDPDLAPTVWLYLNDERVPYWADETTSRQARMVRDATGKSRSYWLRDVAESNGTEVDSFAVLWWLALMQNGQPHVTLDEIESGLTVGDRFGIDTGEQEAADDDPEDESPEA